MHIVSMPMRVLGVQLGVATGLKHYDGNMLDDVVHDQNAR